MTQVGNVVMARFCLTSGAHRSMGYNHVLPDGQVGLPARSPESDRWDLAGWERAASLVQAVHGATIASFETFAQFSPMCFGRGWKGEKLLSEVFRRMWLIPLECPLDDRDKLPRGVPWGVLNRV